MGAEVERRSNDWGGVVEKRCRGVGDDGGVRVGLMSKVKVIPIDHLFIPIINQGIIDNSRSKFVCM